jgi:hypothetical protein
MELMMEGKEVMEKMIFEVLTEVTMEITVFLDTTSCSRVEIYQHGTITYYLYFYPEDGESRWFRNIGKYLPDYTMSHPRRHSACCRSYSHKGYCSRYLMKYSPY